MIIFCIGKRKQLYLSFIYRLKLVSVAGNIYEMIEQVHRCVIGIEYSRFIPLNAVNKYQID